MMATLARLVSLRVAAAARVSRSVSSSFVPLAASPTARGLAQDTGSGLAGVVGERLWSLGRLNHVAVAVPNLEAATRIYRDVLGAQVSGVVLLPDHGVSTVFVDLGNTKIELLEPLGDKSPIAGFLAKNPSGGLHHVCLEVDDLAAAVSAVRSLGVRPLGPEPRTGAHGKPVIFLHPKDCSGVLVELEQA